MTEENLGLTIVSLQQVVKYLDDGKHLVQQKQIKDIQNMLVNELSDTNRKITMKWLLEQRMSP